METSKALSPIARITRYTITDEMRQKSFVIMFVVCAACVFLLRGCYGGNYVVNGQNLDADTVARALANVTFHVIAAGVMVMAALLAMQMFRRDRNEGMQSCILAKPIARWQYVAGKIAGLWVLSVLFMFILHGMVFLITSLNLKVFMPEYLGALLRHSCFTSKDESDQGKHRDLQQPAEQAGSIQLPFSCGLCPLWPTHG